MGDYLEMENDIFFHTPPIFVEVIEPNEYLLRLVRGYVHSKKAIYPEKYSAWKKVIWREGRKGGWFLLGSLPKSMRYCELWMGVISYSNWVMRYCILNQPTKRTATMYESVYNINTYMYLYTMSGILKNPFQ